jgi:hypothetical protein
VAVKAKTIAIIPLIIRDQGIDMKYEFCWRSL